MSIVGRTVLIAVVLAQACGSTQITDRTRLSYTVGAAATNCLDFKQMRAAVRQHLGYDPFDRNAQRAIAVRVGTIDDGLAARIILRGKRGKLVGSREIIAARDDCRELGAAAALAIAMALDPQAARRPKRPLKPKPIPRVSKPIVKAPEIPSEKPTRPTPKRAKPEAAGVPLHLSVGAGGLVAVGSAPAVSGGAQLFVALRRTRFSAVVSGRFYFPASDDAGGGRISAALAGGSLLGCVHHWWLYGCGGLAAFALVGSGHDLADTDQVTLPYVAFDLQLGFDIPIRRFVLRPHLELLLPFTRVTLEDSVTGWDFWTSPVVAGSLGLSITGVIF